MIVGAGGFGKSGIGGWKEIVGWVEEEWDELGKDSGVEVLVQKVPVENREVQRRRRVYVGCTGGPEVEQVEAEVVGEGTGAGEEVPVGWQVFQGNGDHGRVGRLAEGAFARMRELVGFRVEGDWRVEGRELVGVIGLVRVGRDVIEEWRGGRK